MEDHDHLPTVSGAVFDKIGVASSWKSPRADVIKATDFVSSSVGVLSESINFFAEQLKERSVLVHNASATGLCKPCNLPLGSLIPRTSGEEGECELSQDINKARETLTSIWETAQEVEDFTRPGFIGFERTKEELEHTIKMGLGGRFCLTQKEYFGRIPGISEPGDLICIFAGTRTPFVIRPTSYEGFPDAKKIDKQTYQLVGIYYIEGIMDGELKRRDLQLEMFDSGVPVLFEEE